MPWNLHYSPEVIAYFLGRLGALLGPFFGVMAVDNFALRKGRFSIPDLYDPADKSLYYYSNGVNPLAVKAFSALVGDRPDPVVDAGVLPDCPVRLVHRGGAGRDCLRDRGEGTARRRPQPTG